VGGAVCDCNPPLAISAWPSLARRPRISALSARSPSPRHSVLQGRAGGLSARPERKPERCPTWIECAAGTGRSAGSSGRTAGGAATRGPACTTSACRTASSGARSDSVVPVRPADRWEADPRGCGLRRDLCSDGHLYVGLVGPGWRQLLDNLCGVVGVRIRGCGLSIDDGLFHGCVDRGSPAKESGARVMGRGPFNVPGVQKFIRRRQNQGFAGETEFLGPVGPKTKQHEIVGLVSVAVARTGANLVPTLLPTELISHDLS
jgi:hypothetical protein